MSSHQDYDNGEEFSEYPDQTYGFNNPRVRSGSRNENLPTPYGNDLQNQIDFNNFLHSSNRSSSNAYYGSEGCVCPSDLTQPNPRPWTTPGWPHHQASTALGDNTALGDTQGDVHNDDGKSDCSLGDDCPDLGSVCEGTTECCEDPSCEEEEDGCIDDQPCLDKECESDSVLCMRNTCFTATAPPAGGEETAVAQALTSLGGHREPGTSQEEVNYAFNFGNPLPFAGANNGGMNSGTGVGPYHNFQDFTGSINPTPTQFPSFENNEFWNHIFQFHLPSNNEHEHSQHMRPCPADHPVINNGLCPFPNPGANGSRYDLGGQRVCSFVAPDFDSFTEHVYAEHQPQLQEWNGHNLNNVVPPPPNCNQVFNNQNQDYNDIYSQGFFAAPSGGFLPTHQHPTPNSAATVPSLTSTPLPTPESPMEMAPSVQVVPVFKQEVKTKLKQQGHSMGPNDAFRCYWIDHQTSEPCLANFENSDDLDAHCKSAHVKELPKKGSGFQCMWKGCKRQDDSFTTRAKLNRHLQTHTGYKPMVCPTCGLRLSAKQALDQHIRTHTGEHPYECKYGCGQRFKQHSALTMHHRVHSKEKPLVCKVCAATFTESSNLSKHMRTHQVKGAFDCDLCHKNFHRLDQLRRHLKSNHKDQPQAAEDNITRARDWKKKETREHRTNGSRSTSTSAEPPSEIGDLSLKNEAASEDGEFGMQHAGY